jgi:chromosome segregation ATPase
VQVSENEGRIKEHESRIQDLVVEVTRLSGELMAAQQVKAETDEQLEKLKKDQDDLLELLADQV